MSSNLLKNLCNLFLLIALINIKTSCGGGLLKKLTNNLSVAKRFNQCIPTEWNWRL